MDLILWRHAEAHDPHEGEHDLTRRLTSRGEKHAARMADWLDQQLPEGVRILCSPAVRLEQRFKTFWKRLAGRLPSTLCWWSGISLRWALWFPSCLAWGRNLWRSARGRSGGCAVVSVKARTRR